MADVMVDSETLKITCGFVDGDDRTITLKNPKESLTSQNIAELNTWMQENQPIVGDKWGGVFGRILRSTKVTTHRYIIDPND